MPFGDVHILYYEFIKSVMDSKEDEKKKPPSKEELEEKAAQIENAGISGTSRTSESPNVPTNLDAEDLAEELDML